MDNFYFVYKTTNLINEIIYVGQHTQATSGFDGYLGSGILIKRAIKKYGRENFVRETLEYCTSANFDEREICWIAELSATNSLIGYNLTAGGGGVRKGYKHSEEFKQNMSKRVKGHNHPLYGTQRSDETKRKISDGNKGKILSEEAKIKIRDVQFHRSEETKRKMNMNRKGMTGLKHSDKTKKMWSIKRKGQLSGINSSSATHVIYNGTFYATVKEFCIKNNLYWYNLQMLIKKGLAIKYKDKL